MGKTVTCQSCGWVHFEVSRQYAEDEVKSFNEYFDGLTAEQQQDFYNGKKSSVQNYERCMSCGGHYSNFRDSRVGDYPDGCTINPIIVRTE